MAGVIILLGKVLFFALSVFTLGALVLLIFGGKLDSFELSNTPSPSKKQKSVSVQASGEGDSDSLFSDELESIEAPKISTDFDYDDATTWDQSV